MPYSYSNVLYLPFVSLLFRSKISKIERVLKSEDGHYSPFVEEVKHLSNPHILRFSFEKSLKSTDFCLFWFLFWVGKDNLHYSDRLRFLLRFFSGLKIHNGSNCTVEITQYALKGQKLIARLIPHVNVLFSLQNNSELP